MKFNRHKARLKRKQRIRKKISGNPERPRMVVFRSNKHLSVQLVDDVQGHTLAAASTMGNENANGVTKESASVIGQEIANKALAKNIQEVVFDRNGYYYHGRIKALADGARQGGLKF